MKRLLTYGLLLLTILASHFVVSACQDDLPETTEVMMTFTTRAVVTQDNESVAIDEEKMKNLRVIMVREDGTIAYKEVNKIDGSSVTVTFNTPVKTGGENFQFFAIANEDGILPAQNLGSIQSGDIENLKTRVVGSESEFTIINAIPQTKYWTAKINPYESLSVSQQLDYLVSKISVQFKNETNKVQSLSNIHITGITPNGWGSLFNQPTGLKDNEGEEIYKEVYVDSDVTLNNGITFNGVADLPSGESSAIQHYYTYPVDAGNITVDEGNKIYPTLHATWNKKTYELPLEGITELKRNDHLKIIVTLTGHALTINYSIAPWVEEPTNIGSPTTNGGYQVGDWGNGNDIIIGGEIGGGDTPGGGTGEVEVPVWGDKEGEGNLTINWESSYLTVQPSWFNQASIVKGKGPNNNNIDGFQMYVYYDYTGSGSMEVRESTGVSKYSNKVYINGKMGDWLPLNGLNGEEVSIFVPYDIKDTPFTLSGVDYTITRVTVVK